MVWCGGGMHDIHPFFFSRNFRGLAFACRASSLLLLCMPTHKSRDGRSYSPRLCYRWLVGGGSSRGVSARAWDGHDGRVDLTDLLAGGCWR